MRVIQVVSTIVGEGLFVGEPCLLVRLAGCNLHCSWCDTPEAHRGGHEIPFSRLVEQGIQTHEKFILLTGGEPLAQRNVAKLVSRWVEGAKKVIIESNGTLPIEKLVSTNVFFSLDVKTPSSGESGKFLLGNLSHMGQNDILKFVIAHRNDLEWSKDFITKHKIKCEVFFQTVWGQLSPRRLAQWIIEEKLPVRLSVQLHKMIKLQ